MSVTTANHSNVGGYKARTLGASVQTGQGGAVTVSGSPATSVVTGTDGFLYDVWTYTGAGTFVPANSMLAHVLIVGGGGGSGGGAVGAYANALGSGGGGGGMITVAMPLTGGITYTIAIGAGGVASGASGTPRYGGN